MKYKAVIFDMDGVITDSESPYINNFPILCKEQGYNIETKDIKNTLGTSYEYSKDYFLNKYGIDFPYDTIFSYFEDLLVKMAYDGTLHLKPTVIETLNFLKDNSILIALASSNTEKAVFSYLNAFNIKNYFNSILCGKDITNSKPNPEIFLKTLSNLNLTSKECIVVEDSINGLTAAKRAEITSVMIPDLIPYSDKISDIVDFHFNSLYEIITLFK